MGYLYISTTSSDVEIAELGYTITHPTTDFAIDEQFTSREIKNAESLTTAIRNGTLVWKKTSGGSTESPTDYDPDYVALQEENLGLGDLDDRDVLFKDLIASNVWFDNTVLSWPLSEDNVQEAIEYAKSSAEGFGRVPLLMLHNGTLSDGEEVGRNELMADKKYIFPVNFKLTHLTWNNDRSSADFDLEFYRYYNNGTPYPSQPFWTYEVRNKQYDYVDSLNFDFAAGDYMKIVYRDQGTNARDFEGELWGTRI